MKIIVIGASGIIGQHMMISIPPGVDAVFTRRTASPLHQALDLCDWPRAEAFLNAHRPDAIVNLAGENRPDVVERNPDAFDDINVGAVGRLVQWCDGNNVHLVQVSSQATPVPVNRYGWHKYDAEKVAAGCQRWSIVRPTFVLGVSPFPGIGRENPAERILAGKETHSVSNRWFSVSFAADVAERLWQTAQGDPTRRIVNVGDRTRLSRHELVQRFGFTSEPIEHESLPGLAPRPIDTTYTDGESSMSLDVGIQTLRNQWALRTADTLSYRASEIAAFMHLPVRDVFAKLTSGFGELHHAVTADFQSASPHTDEELLRWYRTTDAYIWELTAYHSDSGFNYGGMCSGIARRLRDQGAQRVLCLGDGTGDLTLALEAAGIHPVYNDLADSRIAAFAQSRFFMRLGDGWPDRLLSPDFSPPMGGSEDFDAIVSLDFLEHVPNVEQWARAIHASLKPGGLFCAQNAFGIGSGPDGSIPMHLAANDRFEKDWDPLLFGLGFEQLASNWYRKPASAELEVANAAI